MGVSAETAAETIVNMANSIITYLREIKMETKARNHTSQRISILIMAILFTGQFCSHAYSQDLVVVDGVTSRCVYLSGVFSSAQLPGGTLFPAPRIGHCNGSIARGCMIAGANLPAACVGTFTP
jgi:hypothetical protein